MTSDSLSPCGAIVRALTSPAIVKRLSDRFADQHPPPRDELTTTSAPSNSAACSFPARIPGLFDHTHVLLGCLPLTSGRTLTRSPRDRGNNPVGSGTTGVSHEHHGTDQPGPRRGRGHDHWRGL